MDNIRNEIQDWLESETRKVTGKTKVNWHDIEEVANSNSGMDIKWNKYNRTFHWVHSDAVSIDHLCLEVLEEDFNFAMEILKRYRNLVITDNIFGVEKK